MFANTRNIYKLRDWVDNLDEEAYERCLIISIWALNPNVLTDEEILSVVFDDSITGFRYIDEHLYFRNPLFWVQHTQTLSVDNYLYMDKLARYGSWPLVQQHISKLSWLMVSINPNAISILEKKLDEISWNMSFIEQAFLSSNPGAVHLLEKRLDKIDWATFSANPCAIDVLEKNPEKICWSMFSFNSHPRAIALLEKNLDKIDWMKLSSNPSAISILEKHTDKIYWPTLSSNANAIDILERNVEKIDWKELSLNTNLFTYDYSQMRENMHSSHLAEEIIQKALCPKRLNAICQQYNLDLETLFEIYYS
jgi:hypothetical protein